jgi:hypothetical protein
VFHWNNPNLLWLFATQDEEDYEGSQTQIGLARDGKLKWEFQSHCSCNDYEDSSELGVDFPPTTMKSYELRTIPIDWEAEIEKNLKIILAL